MDQYIDQYGCIDIDTIPIEVLTAAFMKHNHVIKDGYVYGHKKVSSEYTDMFHVNTYEVGKTYEYEESEDDSYFSLFSQFVGDPCSGVHSAGLWSFGMNANCPIYPNTYMTKWITVRYPIKEAMPIGKTIKGRIMEVVSYDKLEVSQV